MAKLMPTQKAMRAAVRELTKLARATTIDSVRKRAAQLALDTYDLANEYDSKFWLDAGDVDFLREAVK